HASGHPREKLKIQSRNLGPGFNWKILRKLCEMNAIAYFMSLIDRSFIAMRRFVCAIAVFPLMVLLSACALPVEKLWPPAADTHIRTIYVSLDTWHVMIAFPLDKKKTEWAEQQAHPPSQLSTLRDHSSIGAQPTYYEEWGYAERAWYLEGRRGVTGAVRALLWPTEGVVEVGQFDRLWAERTPQPPSDLFVFKLSEQGYRRLRRHLAATIQNHEAVASSGEAQFFTARQAYHLFHTCHQYAAHSLREAGLPLSPFWAFNRMTFAWQLRRAVRLAEVQPTAALPSDL
ncbi:MAG TPA: DUF2459 domain-containing protein, partial [Nitrosomonas nitrosa]|nr:DUF2459 domain-containing protein [Nitrosomonas nitrosa]